jgi:antitoxin component YwqK of YwqJK toxin-antitoxin module
MFLATVAVGCRQALRQEAFRDCPAGDRLVGAAPPRGTELYCQKDIHGKLVKDGPFVVFAGGGGKLIEGTYREGVQEGVWTTWYENGQRSAIDHFRDGLQDGLHISWYANGQKAIEGNYRAGKREGVWTRWDPSGLTRKQQTYRDDKVVS